MDLSRHRGEAGNMMGRMFLSTAAAMIGKPELKQPRIDHTLAHLQELAFHAESLQLA